MAYSKKPMDTLRQSPPSGGTAGSLAAASSGSLAAAPADSEFADLQLDGFGECLQVITDARSHPLVFVTGAAGTGKSTLVRYIRYHFAQAKDGQRRNVAVVAPTAVAAVSAGCQTIHSLFGFPHRPAAAFIDEIKPRRRLGALLRRIDTLIIDEVSMVRADMVDAIDRSLRINTERDELFAGIQVVLVGDLLQLPPIISSPEEKRMFPPSDEALYSSSFFPGAKCLQGQTPTTVPLRRVFRQQQTEFVQILHQVRTAHNVPEVLSRLNRHCFRAKPQPWEGITLVTTRNRAERINMRELDSIPSQCRLYEATTQGDFRINDRQLPAPGRLSLKVGARVMLVQNDAKKRWINGTQGEVTALDESSVSIRLFHCGREVEVGQAQWENYRLTYDEKRQRLEYEVVGLYRQLPLILGWAATIHKAQGATMDTVVVDLKDAPFEFGQTYVALSRCRSLEGLFLQQPLRISDVRAEPAARRWYAELMSVN